MPGPRRDPSSIFPACRFLGIRPTKSTLPACFCWVVDLPACKLRFKWVGDSRQTMRFRSEEGIGHTGYIVTGSGMDYGRGACEVTERINAVQSDADAFNAACSNASRTV